MQAVRDVFFPGDEPEIETVDGVRVSKVSPRRRHAETQAVLTGLLRAWARSRGSVGTEWRFGVSGVKSRRDSYVPDIAFVSKERLAALSPEDREEPPFAPDVAVEIFSPGDRESTLATKIERYLAFGASVVLDVRPLERTIVVHDVGGSRTFSSVETFVHNAVPGLTFAIGADLFDEVDPPARTESDA